MQSCSGVLTYPVAVPTGSVREPADTRAQAQDRQHANRIFYLSIPPSIFTDVAACASEAASSASGWNRVIVEKPFGRDLASFAAAEHRAEQLPERGPDVPH